MYNIFKYVLHKTHLNWRPSRINNIIRRSYTLNYSTSIPNRNRSLVTLTDRALAEIRKVTLEGKIIKLSLVAKGCNGYVYDMSLIDYSALDSLDEYYIDSQGNRVLAIDNKAVMYILGTHIDFVEHKDGLSSEFTFTNPNVGSCCGCGLSFNINKSNV